jgi:superfamily I DNA/RNA helicase
LPSEFLLGEVEYVMGRFPKDKRALYLDAERTGRGLAPRVDRSTREQILSLIEDYQKKLSSLGRLDWEDLPDAVGKLKSQNYEIIVVDEAQDFSANQLRSLAPHLSKDHSLTLVIDTAQRLYPRGYTWAEAGINVRSFYRLEQNHRNTVEIATFVQGLLSGLKLDDDGTIPDLKTAERHGPKPIVIKGKYSKQMNFAISHIVRNVALKQESVAFLKPMGGHWFDEARSRLLRDRLKFDEITREPEWPNNTNNIVLSTMHSAKGLEFDHVIILGFSEEVTPHGDEPDDDQLQTLRRLLAMAVARARKTVLIGYKDNEVSKLVKYFKKGTFDEQEL